MRNSYYVKQGWYDGYHGYLMSLEELESLTQKEMWDYEEGLKEGEQDLIIDEFGASREYYHEK